nr:ATP-binding SpoIIE family protein phosphatase [Cupriavidus sp. AU9028]
MNDPSRLGEARRIAASMSGAAGFDSVAAGRVALVVSEMASNLLKHATGGRLLLASRETANGACIDVLSMDAGPGMADLAACRRDGYSSSGSLGQGLGAMERLADEFDLISHPGIGTLIFARIHGHGGPSPRPAAPCNGIFEVGTICLPAPGEGVSGDGWGFSCAGQRLSVMMADGLGHGPGAAAAAQAAQDVFTAQFPADCPGGPQRMVERAHTALRATRGAALTAACLDAEAGTIRYAGAGNVLARVVSGVDDRVLQVQNGTVGVQIRTVNEQTAAWPAHALFILFSDGVQSRWQLDPVLLRAHPALVAAWLAWRYGRGKDDTTVLVVRRART